MIWIAMAAAALASLWFIWRGLPAGPGPVARGVVGGTLLAALAIAVVFYAFLGSPELPDAPLAERADEIAAARDASEQSRQRAADALDEARRNAGARPGDVEAQFALAQAAARAGDSATEIAALEAALAITANPAIKSMIAEALSREAGGVVTPRALEWIDGALEESPGDWRARYLKALYFSQTGDDEAALEYLMPLAAEAVGSPFYPAIAKAVGAAAERLELDPAALLPDSSVSEADIAAMVDGLEARLLAEDSVTDHESWMMLVRSRLVLGDGEVLEQRIEDLLERLDGPRDNPWLDSRLLMAVVEMMLPPDDLPKTIPPVLDRVLARARDLAPDDVSTLFFSGLVARSRGDAANVKAWWGRLDTMLEEGNPIRPLIREELDGLE